MILPRLLLTQNLRMVEIRRNLLITWPNPSAQARSSRTGYQGTADNTYGQLVVHLDCKAVICKASFCHLVPSTYWYLGLFLPRCRTLYLSLLKFEIPRCPFLQSAQLLLSGSTPIWCNLSQFNVTSKLAENTLYHIIQIINENVK